MEVKIVQFINITFIFLISYKAFVLALNELNGRDDSEIFISALIYDSCSDNKAEHVRTINN